VCCCVCSSDTLTDVSSLHDIDDSDDVNDDDMSQCQQVVASDDRSTSHMAVNNLSDLTIPDFTVSSLLSYHFQCVFFLFLPSSMLSFQHFCGTEGLSCAACC